MHDGERRELSWFTIHTQLRLEAVAEAFLGNLCQAAFCRRYRNRMSITVYRERCRGGLFVVWSPGPGQAAPRRSLRPRMQDVVMVGQNRPGKIS